jgi:hypothetical protein
MRGCLARLSGGALLLLVFGLLAILIWRDSPASPAALEQPDAAKRYAAAWVDGSLDGEDYDPSSGPDVGKADPRRIDENVTWMVGDISPDHQNRPTSVQLVGAPRTVTAAEGELLSGDQRQAMRVTWDLGRGASWTYTTEVVVRTTDGRQRVMWRPTAVHPALTHGLVLHARRLRSERAPVLYADDTELRTDRPDPDATKNRGATKTGDATKKKVPAPSATALIGKARLATHELAETSPDRVAQNDVIGISGLEFDYDAQLAGTPGIEIDVIRGGKPDDYTPLEPSVRPVHVVPPLPGKPLRLTLDPRWQTRADDVVKGAKSPTAVVALDALTGRVLAVATGGSDREIALHGAYPPGAVFRIATTLALPPHNATKDQAPADCTPFLHEGQRFVNAPGVTSDGPTTIGAAFERNCRTALARAARAISPEELHAAAEALGIGVPSATGASAYDGFVPDKADPLGLVQNALGEGSVLVSPLAMARASAAVASGTQRASTLVMPIKRVTPDPAPKVLDSTEQAVLQRLMRASVASDDQLTPLRAATRGQVSAIAGMAGYGPATSAPVHAWCTGYQGTLAFAVLVTGEPGKAPTGPYPALHAAEIAAAFLG